MDSKTFEKMMYDQFAYCANVLHRKAGEYATSDRLHNFKAAAALQATTPKNALAGMLSKHTISIFDMCRDSKAYTYERWNEKITDHINYLLLLKALVVEDLPICEDRGQNIDSYEIERDV